MVPMKVQFLGLLLVSFLAVGALADEVVLDFSTMPGTNCNVEWIEGPCVLMFGPITAEDYQPVMPPQLVCFPFLNVSTLILYPARLYVDLTGVDGIEIITVDVQEGAEPGATRVMAYLGGNLVKEANSIFIGSHSITLQVAGETFDTLVISGWETALMEIQLYGSTLVGTEGLSLGTVKALYR